MNQILATAATVVVALGGGGAIVLGLSGYLGKIWADRMMARDRAHFDRELERLRADLSAHNSVELERLRADLTAKNAVELEQVRASMDMVRTKLLGAHADKVALYRIAVDIVSEMIADITASPQGVGGFVGVKPAERMHRFDRDRLRAYGYLGMFAPQHVMDAFDRVIDYLFAALEGSAAPDFGRVRELGIAMLNEIRLDLAIDRTPIEYRGER